MIFAKMLKIRRVVSTMLLCCVLSVSSASAQAVGESELYKMAMKGINKLFPNITEVAWVSNALNVLYQVAQLSRSTLSLIARYKESYAQILATVASIERVFEDLEDLYYNFDPYNLDSWASTLRGVNYIIDYDCYGALYAWSAVEFVSATSDFIIDAANIGDNIYRHQKNREFIEEYYYNMKLDSLRELAYANTVRSYAEMTNRLIGEEQERLRIMLEDTTVDESIKDGLREQIIYLDNKSSGFAGKTFFAAVSHVDTLMDFIYDLMVYNLTSVHILENKIYEYENAADFLVDQFYSLKDGVGNQVAASTSERETIKSDSVSSEISLADSVAFDVKYPGDPNLVVKPGETRDNSFAMIPTKTMPKFSLKREDVSYHDIAHLQNGVDFVLLQQEMALRDLAVLKAKSAAVILATKAYREHSSDLTYLRHINDVLGITQ